MSPSQQPSQNQEGQTPRGESAALQWQRQWQHGEPGDVRHFLAQHPSLKPVEKAAVLLIDLRERWLRGESLAIETLLGWYPEVYASPEAAVELIYGAFLLRKQLGDEPDPEEYLRRFPEHADWLGRQFSLYSDLRTSSLQASEDTREYHSSQAETGELPEEMPGSPSSDTQEDVCQRIGRYVVRATLGKGGMGIAYRAWDPVLQREVVIKTLRSRELVDAADRLRFRTEAQAIAQVRHPHVVEVFDVGEYAGEPYFTMELCEGGSLVGLLSDPLPPRVAATLVEQIARGIAAAHARNVIHRDLKPGNVLLDRPREEEGQAVAPVPKVADFGLAKMLDTDDDQTRTGAIMGTPAYMAPEQAEGKSKAVGPAADVYALGVILYECLTGKPPFKGATVAETLDQVRHREPVPLRQLQPKTPLDLETIALKCLEKEPARRYASATALAEDLTRYLEGRPIQARRTGLPGRAWRWCRRNPVVASLLVLVLVVLLGGTISTTMMWLRARASYEEAQHNYQKSEKSFDATVRAVNAYFRTISENRLLHLPSMSALRKELMSEARPFYAEFVRQRRDDPRLAFEYAQATAALAEIEYASGSRDASLALWTDAIKHYEQLTREDPGNVERLAALARARKRYSKALTGIGRREEAMAEGQVAVSAYSALTERLPRHWYFLNLEGECCQELAYLLAISGKTDQALALSKRGLECARKAYLINPDQPYRSIAVGHAHASYGQLLERHGSKTEALEVLIEARSHLARCANVSFFAQPIARYDLARALGILGGVYTDLRRWDEAESTSTESVELLQQFVHDAPAVAEYRNNLATAKHNLALLYIRLNKPARAEPLCKEAMALRQELYEQNPQDLSVAYELANSYRQMVNIARANKDTEGRLHWNGEALKLLLEIKKLDPTPQVRALLVWTAGGRGQLLCRQRRYREALPDLDLALECSPEPPLVALLVLRALCRAHLGDWQGAMADHHASVARVGTIEDGVCLVRALALCYALVTRDTTLSKEAQQEQERQLLREALPLLNGMKASDKMSDAALRMLLLQETDLEGLRSHDALKPLLRSLDSPPSREDE